jgi:hypothetical protein
LRVADDERLGGAGPFQTHSQEDRLAAMWLERLQAVRELHDDVRRETRERFQQMSEICTRLEVAMGRLSERQETHEAVDREAFSRMMAAIETAQKSANSRMDGLALALTQATTASAIQKAQLATGWKVVAVLGSMALAMYGVVMTFLNYARH